MVDGASELRFVEIRMVVQWREHVTVPHEMHVHGRRVEEVVARPARVRLDERDPTLTVPSDGVGNLREDDKGSEAKCIKCMPD